MAKLRQLQQDLDKKLKAIEEGCESFNSILKRIPSAINPTQKDKYESELKKEIKKLQRLREALKPYISNPEVRDKNTLHDARRKIEQFMITYKQFEKDNKTKAYSKEGLAQTSRSDPYYEERISACDWVKSTQEMLIGNMNLLEAELDKLSSRKSKKQIDEDSMSDLRKRIEQFRYHYDKLELILRALENEAFSTIDKIWELKDLLESLLENSDSSDYLQIEIDQIYEDLHLINSSFQTNDKTDPDSSRSKLSVPKKPEPRKPSPQPTKVPEEQKTESKPVSAWSSGQMFNKLVGEKVEEPKMEEEELADQHWNPEENRVQDLQAARQLIDRSYAKHIRPSERGKSCLQILKNPHPVHSSFPCKPYFTRPEEYSRLELDSLFFIFYHQPGTYQQYLAAKQLKSKNWIYHKRYQTWFQRCEEPRMTTDDKEQGTYVYFDYDTGWCQRRKTDFTFEYSYLEDELSS